MKRVMLALALTVAATTAVAANQTSGRGHSNKPPKHDHAADDTRVVASVRFSTGDQRAIHEYYATRSKSLPPGLQKKVARGGQLPPGWQKKMQPFPSELERRFGPLPREHARGVIDGHAVIYNTRSHAVLDVTVQF